MSKSKLITEAQKKIVKPEWEKLQKFIFDFDGKLEMKAKSREDAIAKICGHGTMAECNEVNDEILASVNFTF